MITAMSPSTTGNREVMAVDAVPVDLRGAGEQDVAPAGTSHCVQAVELSI